MTGAWEVWMIVLLYGPSGVMAHDEDSKVDRDHVVRLRCMPSRAQRGSTPPCLTVDQSS